MVVRHFPSTFGNPDDDSMTASPTYSYTGRSTTPRSSTLPYASLFPTATSNMTSHSHPTSNQQDLPTLTDPFPPLLPAPSGLQIRLQDQTAVLSTIDTSLSQKEEEEGLPPILDESRMVARGRVEAMEEEELSVREARMALDEFVRNRTPYAVLASQRLQAVLGEKNTLDFELPEVPLNMTPFLNRLSPHTTGPTNKLSPSFSPRNRSSSNGGSDRRKDSGVGLPLRSPLSPISPWGFCQVDEKTGKGLREWLLSRGKETGTQRKRECRSISFHDFTPDMRTGTHANVLVAHYNGGGLHERADVYEVDLPTTYTDSTTNLPTQGTQTWLWFLISRPVLTLSPTETNTDPSPLPDSEKWARLGIYTPKPPNVIRPPPDFPMPIPASYVVFACPASNVTAYPDCKDDSASPAPPPPSTSYMHTLAPSYLTSHTRSRPRATSTSQPAPAPPKKIYKRKDYDFSFQGTPIFEFSQAETFSVPNRSRFEILSIDALGSWYPHDVSGSCSLPEYQHRVREWEAEVENLGREERKDDDRNYRDRSAEVPHAKKGSWWETFYEGVYREEGKWRRIRECMSRGKCRIVVRWVETESSPPLPTSSNHSGGHGARKKLKMSPNLGFSSDDADADADSDMSDGAGIGLGLDFGVGQGGRLNGSGTGIGTDGKKIKERLVGRRPVSGQARVTRSEARRKSGLGMVSTSQEGLNSAMVGGNANGHAGVLIGIGHGAGVVGVDGSNVNANAGGAAKDKRRKK